MGAALFASVPSGTYRCKDGLVYLMVNRPLHWKALAQWIYEVTGNDVVLDPMFEGLTLDFFDSRDDCCQLLSPLTFCLCPAGAADGAASKTCRHAGMMTVMDFQAAT